MVRKVGGTLASMPKAMPKQQVKQQVTKDPWCSKTPPIQARLALVQDVSTMFQKALRDGCGPVIRRKQKGTEQMVQEREQKFWLKREGEK